MKIIKLRKKNFNKMQYKFLDKINFPDDLRDFKINELDQIAKE